VAKSQGGERCGKIGQAQYVPLVPQWNCDNPHIAQIQEAATAVAMLGTTPQQRTLFGLRAYNKALEGWQQGCMERYQAAMVRWQLKCNALKACSGSAFQ
jgi:hypothetical protein